MTCACGKELKNQSGRGRPRQFCSVECSSLSRKGRYKHRPLKQGTCVHCGREFQTHTPARMYCSEKCGRPHRPSYTKSHSLPCAQCGREIMGQRGDDGKLRKFCSRDCSFDHERQEAEYRREHIWTQDRRGRHGESLAALSTPVEFVQCRFCSKLFCRRQSNKRKMYCSRICLQTGSYLNRLATCRRPKQPGVCKFCGNEFKRPAGTVYCSDFCSGKAARHKRRWRSIHPTYEGPTFKRIYDKENGKCYLCGLLAPRIRAVQNIYQPHQAVIEHVQPLCAHGKNEESNCRIAHHLCNSIKSTDFPVWINYRFRDAMTGFIFEVVRGEREGLEIKQAESIQ